MDSYCRYNLVIVNALVFCYLLLDYVDDYVIIFIWNRSLLGKVMVDNIG